MRTRLFLPMLLAFLSATATLLAQFTLPGPPKATPSLVADASSVAPGKPFTVGIRFELADGWHVYWQFPGDSGAAPQVQWQLPPGFEASPIQWPLPHLLKSEGDIFTNVYEKEVLLPVLIFPPKELPASPVVLKAKLKWYVCKETCLPGEEDVELELPVGAGAPANPEEFTLWKSRLPQSGTPPFQTEWSRTADALFVRLRGLPPGAKAEVFPIPPAGAMAEHAEPDATRAGVFRIPSSDALKQDQWRALIVLEDADHNRRGWEQQAGNWVPLADISPAAKPGGESPAPAAGSFAGVLWAAFLGGLLLNLMPCVLPVIALKIFGFTQQAGQDPKKVFRLGLSFCAGVFAFFLGLAFAVIALKSAGSGLNWGFQFQNPWILAGLIAAVFVFGLNLLGVFEITLASGANTTLSALSNKEGHGGAFLHGAFTTLLGTSCTAPYLGVTLGFAVSQPAPAVIAIFLTIAAGMSLPYLLLTSNPALLRFLPKPGMWMERLKQIMGFVILGVAVWLLGVLGESRGSAALAGACAFLLVLGVGCWLLGVMRNRAVALGLALVLAAAGYRVFLHETLTTPAPAPTAGASEKTSDGWVPFSPERLASERAAGKPVFLDFTANWCLNCKVNERLTLSKPEVLAAFEKKGVVRMKADWTNGDPEITAILNKFKRVGVPFYLLYPAGQAEPIVFPELLTPALVLETLEKLGSR